MVYIKRQQKGPKDYINTGNLAEEYLGGASIQPGKSHKLVDEMAKQGELVGSRFKTSPHFEEEMKLLPRAIKALLDLTEASNQRGNGTQQQEKARKDEIFQRMMDIKERLGHELILEALIRYNINAVPNNYTPWEPVPLGPETKKRLFVSELQEEICERFNTTDYSKVQFYNSTNSPLDLIYSTDGFFVLDGSLFNDGKRRVQLIDITTRQKGREKNPSGSLILYMDMDRLEDTDIDEYRESFAAQIRKASQEETPDQTLEGFTSKFDRLAA
ncbi:hypothetical protein ACFL10_01185 [Patescibacteria group bacterium]